MYYYFNFFLVTILIFFIIIFFINNLINSNFPYILFGYFIKINNNFNPKNYNLDFINYYAIGNKNNNIMIWDFENIKSNNIIIYVHGIFSNRAFITRRELCVKLFKNNYHVISYDSDNYGESKSLLTNEESLLDNLIFLYFYIKNRYSNKKITFWCHSLGTGIGLHAIYKLEKEYNIKTIKIILESAFLDIYEAIKNFSKFLFNFANLKNLKKLNITFDNKFYIANITSKVLLLHAINDETIKYQHSYELMLKCINCKFILFPDGKHNYIYKKNFDIIKIIQNFIN